MKIILTSTVKTIVIFSIGLLYIFKGKSIVQNDKNIGKLRIATSQFPVSVEIDTEKSYYSTSKPFRMDAINGKLYSGESINDARSKNRTIY
jgi:hypothetical protein